MSVQRLGGAMLVVAGLFGGALAQDKAPEKEEREGGILGTGIVGTVTALGSIEVNSQRVVFAADMMAEGRLGPMPAADLRPGDVVVAEVVPEGRDWRAMRLEEFLALVGPAAADGTIAGVAVRSDAALKEGDWYAVSGLWKGRELMASRIRAVPRQEMVLVRGTYMEGHVGGVVADLPDTVPFGASIAVRIGPAGDVIAYRRGLFGGQMGKVIVEGYLSPPDADGMYTVLGSGLMAQTDQPSMIDPARRGVFCASPGQSGEMAQIAPMGEEGCH